MRIWHHRVQLALEADDVVPERGRIIATGWPLAEDLRDTPVGLKDFRVLDPAGYYLRIRDRARVDAYLESAS